MPPRVLQHAVEDRAVFSAVGAADGVVKIVITSQARRSATWLSSTFLIVSSKSTSER
jgi:hypothetical protein